MTQTSKLSTMGIPWTFQPLNAHWVDDITEALVGGESLSVLAHQVPTASSSVAGADSLLGVISFSGSLSSSVPGVDVITGLQEATLTLSSPVAGSDSRTVSLHTSQSISGSVPAADSMDFSFNGHPMASSSVVGEDTSSANMDSASILTSDPGSGEDSIIGVISWVGSVTGTVGANASFTASFILAPSINEPLLGGDSAVILLDGIGETSDPVSGRDHIRVIWFKAHSDFNVNAHYNDITYTSGVLRDTVVLAGTIRDSVTLSGSIRDSAAVTGVIDDIRVTFGKM